MTIKLHHYPSFQFSVDFGAASKYIPQFGEQIIS